jgi:outer membrane lipoprotein-sorting protein
MNKSILLSTLIFLVNLQPIFSQYDPEALAVLDAMSAKYKEISSFEAEFTQKLVNKSAGLDENIMGKIAIKKINVLRRMLLFIFNICYQSLTITVPNFVRPE